jgi:outer membrane protein assembly factor BamB
MRRALPLVAAAALSGGCAAVPVYGDPTFAGGGEAPPVRLLEVDWTVPLVPEVPLLEYAPREAAGPAVDPDSGRIIALTRDGRVQAVSSAGHVEWTYKTPLPFNAAPLLAGGRIYVSGGNGTVYALNDHPAGPGGELLWQYDANEDLATTPVLAGKLLLVATQADTVVALDAEDGRWLWQYRRDTPSGFTIRGASRPVVDGARAYVGFADGTLVALELTDGTPRWERHLGVEGAQFVDVDTAPVVDAARNRVYAASYRDGVFALDLATGETAWTTATRGVTSLVQRGGLLFGAGDGRVTALKAEGGQVAWTLELKGRLAHAPAQVQGLLLVPTEQALLFVDPLSGRIRQSWNPGRGVTATPAWYRDRLYVLSNLGHLYALALPGQREG